MVLGLVLTACWNPFAPRLSQSLESSDMVVTDQKTPEDVLQNFKVAYTFRDSLLYSDLLDTAFLFVYFNPDEGTSGRFDSWGREMDLRTTGRMFRYFQVIELVWKATLNEQDEETFRQMSRGFDLTLLADDFNVKLSGKAVFSFRKCADNKWRIVQWRDDSDN